MANKPTSPQHSDRPSTAAAGGQDAQGKLQGEGDYEAARRYRKEVKEFLEHTDVEEQARAAAPDSSKQERELALAEQQGKDRSKGDDPVDVGLMYPGRTTDDAQSTDESQQSGGKKGKKQ
jgi:hypothetical protein